MPLISSLCQPQPNLLSTNIGKLMTARFTVCLAGNRCGVYTINQPERGKTPYYFLCLLPNILA